MQHYAPLAPPFKVYIVDDHRFIAELMVAASQRHGAVLRRRAPRGRLGRRDWCRYSAAAFGP